MSLELSRMGVGPRIAITTLMYAALAALASHGWPEFCLIASVPRPFFIVSGIVLLAAGVPTLEISLRAAMRAYNSDKLATTGVFGIVRNPIYATWILLLIPGIVLLTSTSWPLFLTPLVAYVAFKSTIRRENDYLEKRFGNEYRKYKAEVNELIPWPKWHR
jgi:protein-S-isoprenylcysteine O-methyltransferase Ste14